MNTTFAIHLKLQATQAPLHVQWRAGYKCFNFPATEALQLLRVVFGQLE